MAGILAIVVLLVSALLLGTMILALVLLRKGEGPSYSPSRAYEANRRDALGALTGETVDAVPGGQWYDAGFGQAGSGAEWTLDHREAVHEALRAVVPDRADLVFEAGGRVRVGEDVWVVPAVSTAALRAEDLATGEEEARLVVGLVLFNPEPPGGEATHVTLPVQALFPALERAGRADLIRRFEALRERGDPTSRNA
ncbi:MAG: hypothetical protein KY397_01300 [Gemmatimonadetes bacterium]|nr:hypothetical protein [Gemmatimonadota bacterium]